MTGTEPRPSKMVSIDKLPGAYYHIQTHGGIGDCLWVIGKKLSTLDRPLYVSVSNENRHRPRRVGRLLDHLPAVIGWRYADGTFGPNGADWTQDPNDPACAMGAAWSDLRWRANTAQPYRIECNRWLETGRRIEAWLPDLPTVHRVTYTEPGDPPDRLAPDNVVLHIAGWNDVPDPVWVSLARMFSAVADVYIVGGSYDHRPRNVHRALGLFKNVHLLEDVSWETLFGVLRRCAFCLGHASGFTAVADTLGVNGLTYNPRSVRRLVRTWNDPAHAGNVHVDRVEDFERGAVAAYDRLRTGGSGKPWPPELGRWARVQPTGSGGLAARVVRGAATAVVPTRSLFLFDAPVPDPDVVAVVPHAVMDAGELVDTVAVVTPSVEALAGLYGAAARTTRKFSMHVRHDRGEVDADMFGYRLVVVAGSESEEGAVTGAQWAWDRTAVDGLMLITGPHAFEALRALNVVGDPVASAVEGAPGWYYLYRDV